MKLAPTCAHRANSPVARPRTSAGNRRVSLLLALALSLVLACAPLAGCSSPASESSVSATSAAQSSAQSSAPAAQSSASAAQSSASADAKSEATVTVNVKGDYDDMSIDETSTLDIDDGVNALDALKATGLDVVVTDSSFGPYVMSIEGLEASGSNGWTYSVNGEMPSVSAADYVLEDGDVVDWSYYVA